MPLIVGNIAIFRKRRDDGSSSGIHFEKKINVFCLKVNRIIQNEEKNEFEQRLDIFLNDAKKSVYTQQYKLEETDDDDLNKRARDKHSLKYHIYYDEYENFKINEYLIVSLPYATIMTTHRNKLNGTSCLSFEFDDRNYSPILVHQLGCTFALSTDEEKKDFSIIQPDNTVDTDQIITRDLYNRISNAVSITKTEEKGPPRGKTFIAIARIRELKIFTNVDQSDGSIFSPIAIPFYFNYSYKNTNKITSVVNFSKNIQFYGNDSINVDTHDFRQSKLATDETYVPIMSLILLSMLNYKNLNIPLRREYISDFIDITGITIFNKIFNEEQYMFRSVMDKKLEKRYPNVKVLIKVLDEHSEPKATKKSTRINIYDKLIEEE